MMIAQMFWAATEHMVYLRLSGFHFKQQESCIDSTHIVNIDVGGVSLARYGAGAAAASKYTKNYDPKNKDDW